MKDSTYLDALNKKQKEAVLHTGKGLLLLAGAGSGKTRVITSKIAYSLEVLRYHPSSILAVTFTNKAAREMRERVNALLGCDSHVQIRTFHSFGSWFLRQEAWRLGFNQYFSIYDDEDSVSLLNSLVQHKQRSELGSYAHLISRAKDYALHCDDDLTAISTDPEFPGIYKQYQKRLEDIGNFDFGDLILKPLSVLQSNAELKTAYHQRYKLILVDEYQDSNIAQYELLKQLTGSNTAICVVGDDDQSIYKFRGAEVQNILDFQTQFEEVDIIRLEENYRSTGCILEIASNVVANNTGRLGKTLWTSNEYGSKAFVKALEDQHSEAEYCAAKLHDGKLKGTAILYRTNAQSVPFEQVFTQQGIPYRLVGATRFYDREEVKDVISWLSFLLNQHDELAFSRIINKPARGLGKRSVARLVELSQRFGGNLIQALEQAHAVLKGKAATAALDIFHVCQTLIHVLETQELFHLVRDLVEKSSLMAYYSDVDRKTGSAKLANLDALIAQTAKYGAGLDALSQFLEQIELDQSLFLEQEANVENCVTLITIHNTKGLEFDRVFITGMENDLFPGKQQHDAEEIEEERRLFYVAITRAKKELFLTYCHKRRIWGKIQMQIPSLFLNEVPENCVDTPALDEAGGSGYPCGTAVYHDDYGTGIVVKEWQTGINWLLLVRFESGHTAQFIPQYTPLEKVAIN